MSEFRGKIYNDITETIGATPIVRLSRLEKEENLHAQILAKCDFFNPLSSVKDRVGLSMIEEAEEKGLLNEDSIIVEATSGNTGIALAGVCAAKGYKLIIVMPENMSIERRKMLNHLGAKVILTPASLGMSGAINKADEIIEENPDAILMKQFENEANPNIHKKTTAIEIINDVGTDIDYLVCGVGTGGTITGTSKALKQKCPNIKIVAVEPKDSAVISGNDAGAHKIQGIGAGFIPKILQTKIIDEILKISNEEAFEYARKIAKLEGIPVGISSGAALCAATKIASKKEMENKKIVVILPSFAERYLSTELFEDI
jgi:cysteine synthase A